MNAWLCWLRVQNCKPPNCPSTGEWLNKLRCIIPQNTTQQYKRNASLIHTPFGPLGNYAERKKNLKRSHTCFHLHNIIEMTKL